MKIFKRPFICQNNYWKYVNYLGILIFKMVKYLSTNDYTVPKSLKKKICLRFLYYYDIVWQHTWASQSLSKSSDVNAFSLIINLSIFSSFSTYCGWCKLSLNTIVNTWLFWTQSCKRRLVLFIPFLSNYNKILISRFPMSFSLNLVHTKWV